MQASQHRMWVGFDLQFIKELIGRTELLNSRSIFTPEELTYLDGKKDRSASVSGLIAAKEAFVKAISGITDEIPIYNFPDLEVCHLENGRPFFSFKNKLDMYFESKSLYADVSISHSGDYAAAIVIISCNNTSYE